jgi:uncharacterized protein
MKFRTILSLGLKCLFICAALFWSVQGFGANEDFPKPPYPPKLVNDFAHILTSSQVETLEDSLNNFNKSTSSQFAIITETEMGGGREDLESYVNELYRYWGIGEKGKDNGLLIYVAVKNHKIRIEAGYRMNTVVTEIVANSIIENYIEPYFKEGDYYGGLRTATDTLMKVVRTGSFNTPLNERHRSPFGSNTIFVAFLIFFILIFILRRIGGRGGRGGRGPGGFGGGFFGGPFIGGGGFGGGGFGGGGGGGGFGGFGGGSSGGGGASGSW